MVKFTLSIECDNAAFDGSDAGPELARILLSLARDVAADLRFNGRDSGRLRDGNGNVVGAWSYKRGGRR